jgi:hypothetical protein
MQRFGLRDDQWGRIKDLLPGREGHVGGGNAADNRLFVSRRVRDLCQFVRSWSCLYLMEDLLFFWSPDIWSHGS